jgi:hypothetical protein
MMVPSTKETDMRLHLAALALLGAATLAQAAPAAAPSNHPILGIWLLEVPDTDCTETYHFGANGVSLVTSAEEVSQSEFSIDARPTARGFYKLRDRVVKDNGRKDCAGNITRPGMSTVNYVRFNRDATVFVMCEAESLQACIGPFRRKPGQDV